MRTELQADCYAGIWAHYASTVKQDSTGVPYLEPSSDKDIADALSAAASVATIVSSARRRDTPIPSRGRTVPQSNGSTDSPSAIRPGDPNSATPSQPQTWETTRAASST